MQDKIGIYKIQNKLNGKIYIGQSKHIYQRWKQHKSCQKPNAILTIAFQKYGIDNFSFEIIEECNQKDLDEKEKYWIKYYNSYEDGYNLTRGGASGFYYDIEKVWEVFQQTNNIAHTAKIIGCHETTVRNIVHAYGVNLSKVSDNKAVWQIDPQTLNIIKEYPSITDAASACKIDRAGISLVLSGKHKSAGGYLWVLKNSDLSNLKSQTIKAWKKRVAQLDPQTEEVIQIFSSCAEAYKVLGISSKSSSISAVCNNRQKTAYGYKWKFI